MTALTLEYAPVDKDGTKLSFIDSGAPAHSNDYLTFVVFHGLSMHAGIFQWILERAPAKNIRFVAVNRRGYSSSTPYNEEELEEMERGNLVFLERCAREVAAFLTWFVKTHTIPKRGADGKGCLAVGGYSLGSMLPLALLGNPEAIPKEQYDVLVPYLTRVVLIDSAYSAQGVVRPEGAYLPFADSELTTPEAQLHAFSIFITSYYSHPDIERGLEGMDLVSKRTARASFEISGEKTKPLCDDYAREELRMFGPEMQAQLNLQLQRALFDENRARKYFPDVQVIYQTFACSPWVTVWPFYSNRQSYQELRSEGKALRSTKFQLIPGINHTVFIDNPDAYISSIEEWKNL